MGKAYANRKKESERPENDFYETPHCLTRELLKAYDEKCGGRIFKYSVHKPILDPCCGKKAIGNVLREEKIISDFYDVRIIEKDLVYGDDFLEKEENGEYKDLTHYETIIMNPPFKIFNEFVKKAKLQSDYVYCIGRMDYFCTHDRNIENLWEHLEWVLPFDRKVAYDKPLREDGKVEVGMLNSCWFVWNKYYHGYPKIKVLDIDEYVLRKKESK